MNRIKFDDGAKFILIVLIVSQLFFLNGFYLFVSILFLYFGLYHIQQPYKSSVFTIIFLYHFIQIIAGVWQATYLGNNINYRSGNMATATIVSLIGLVVLFAPIIYYQNKIPNLNLAIIKKHAYQLSIKKTFYAYLIAFFFTGALNGVKLLFPGYTQIIISIVNIKWFFFLLFGFQCILKNTRKKEFYFFIALEFLLGFYSFFSDFKTILFFIGVLYVTFLTSVTIKKLAIGAAVASLVFAGATIWTVIKVDYRTFLNKGAVSQNVEVTQNEALTKLYEITNTKGAKVTSSATERFLDRLQGTFHLAKTMDRVPDVIPYQKGGNWGETLAFIFTPRLFNPDKGSLNSSVKASKYTGTEYAGLDQATAFSIGYFADCYIDFGIIGIIIILFLIGLLLGATYFYFLRTASTNYIFNYSIVCALFMTFYAFEMDNIFFMGRLLTDLFTYFILSKTFFPWLYKTLLAPNEQNS